MNQSFSSSAETEKQSTPASKETRGGGSFGRYLSLGVKLPITFILLIGIAFLITTFLSVQIGRTSLINALKDRLITQASLQTESTRSYLIWTRSLATDLAANVEANSYNQDEILNTIKTTLGKNDQIYGSTIAYEPYQFQPDLYYWSPYYSRSTGGDLRFTQLGNAAYNYFQWDWYALPKAKNAPVLSPPYFDKGGGEIWMVTWSVPFYDKTGNFKGVATADIAFSQTQDFVRQITVGQQGYAFLIDSQGTVLGIGEHGGNYETMVQSMKIPETSQKTVGWNNMIQSMTEGKSDFLEVTGPQGKPLYVAYQPIGLDTGWSLGLAYPTDELFQPVTQLQNTLIAVAAIIVMVFSLILFLFSRTITTPLQQLAIYAREFTQGQNNPLARKQMSKPVRIETHDEMEILGDAFNQMTGDLTRSFETLEERVAERTSELEDANRLSQRRNEQFQAVAQITRLIVSIRNTEELLPTITRVISDRFGFYHVGIFLLDEARQYAILSAANSEGGLRMLKRGHRVGIGETGLVGYVASKGFARIALDTGTDAAYFNNPDLPNTRSEMAIPLQINRNIIGVLDVQSTEPKAFIKDDIETLTTLADQVAIAIQNAQLFRDTQTAIAESQILYGTVVKQSWSTNTQVNPQIGYRFSGTFPTALEQPVTTPEVTSALKTGNTVTPSASETNKGKTLAVPLILRGETIGVVNVNMPEGFDLGEDETDIVRAAAERIVLALENSSLLEESQRRAAREKTISEMSAKIGAGTEIENILMTVVRELGTQIGEAQVSVEIGSENE